MDFFRAAFTGLVLSLYFQNTVLMDSSNFGSGQPGAVGGQPATVGGEKWATQALIKK